MVAPETSRPLLCSPISSGVPMITRLASPSFKIFSAATHVLRSMDSGRTMVFLSALAFSLIISITAIILFTPFLMLKHIVLLYTHP